MAKQKKQNIKGFSLVEIMVAIMILGVAFIGLMGAFPYALSIISEAKNIAQASYLAQEKIEELYHNNYDSIATGTIEVKGRLGATGTYLFPYQRETVVTLVDSGFATSSADYGLKKISTTIYYINAFSKREKSYNLTTIISRRQ